MARERYVRHPISSKFESPILITSFRLEEKKHSTRTRQMSDKDRPVHDDNSLLNNTSSTNHYRTSHGEYGGLGMNDGP